MKSKHSCCCWDLEGPISITDFAAELSKKLKEELADISESLDWLIHVIFKKYLKNNKDLLSVIGDLNTFFWSGDDPEYIKTINYIKVRGGKRKESAVEEISTRTGIPIPEMIVLGDSIIDINMLGKLKQEGGISISFNGNKFSVKHANIAVTNSLGVLPIFQEKHNLKNFLQSWEKSFKNFQNNPKKIENSLLSQECIKFFIKYNFIPEINDLTNKSAEQLEVIILKHERMRKMVRG